MNEMLKKVKAAILSERKVGDIMDAVLEFSDAQSLNGATPYQVSAACFNNVQASTNYIDLGDAYVGKGVGRGTPVYINVSVNTAHNTAAATFQVWVATSSNATTWATNILIASLLGANLATVGVTIARVALPAQDLARYIQLGYGISNGTIKVDAWLSLDAPRAPLDTVTWGWNG
jgi:hypothetical protein